jgi:hypothetical protein
VSGEDEREVPRVPLVGVERGGNLLRPGSFTLENSLGYSHNRSSRLILTGFSVIPLVILGTLESEKVTQDSFGHFLSLRAGLVKDLQFDFGVPTSYTTRSNVRLSNERVTLTSDGSSEFGIGDLVAGLTYQPIYERGWIPDVTTSLRVGIPTAKSQFDIFEDISKQGSFSSIEDFVSRLNREGTALGSGFWNLTGRVSMVKAFDPVILFGNVGYTYNFARDVTTIEINGEPVEGGIRLIPKAVKTNIQPGDSLQFGVGFALAMNNQLSVSFGFSERYVMQTKREGEKITDSELNVAQFSTGFNLALGRRTSVDFSWNIGLTPDAPSFTVGFTVPVYFDSWRDLVPGSLLSLSMPNLFSFWGQG